MTDKLLEKLDRYIKIFQENDRKYGDDEFCATTLILMDCKQEIQRLRDALEHAYSGFNYIANTDDLAPNRVKFLARQRIKECAELQALQQDLTTSQEVTNE